MKPRLILVHGAFCGGWSFETFRRPFEAAGYACVAPDLPGRAGEDAGPANLSMRRYADEIARLAASEPEPPVLVGHSMGGLVAQMAATRAPLSGLVLLAPSAPWGVAGSTLEEAASAVGLYALGPFWAGTVPPDREVAKIYSLDRLRGRERRKVLERMTPESGLALFETLNWWLDPFMTTRVDPALIRCPVLVLSGGADLIHPPQTVRQTAARLGAELRVFPGMSHWLIGESGWEEVATACLDWLESRRQAAA